MSKVISEQTSGNRETKEQTTAAGAAKVGKFVDSRNLRAVTQNGQGGRPPNLGNRRNNYRAQVVGKCRIRTNRDTASGAIEIVNDMKSLGIKMDRMVPVGINRKVGYEITCISRRRSKWKREHSPATQNGRKSGIAKPTGHVDRAEDFRRKTGASTR